ncbi:MAG: NAD(P)H-quinone oxidoreductase [bacterium]|nr:NAD(P)H-quinone oxidoreductase [bacterium]
MLAVLPTSRAPVHQREPVLGEMPDPRPGKGEALLRVRASALNRADLLQIRGLYPPPPGESEVPGLECAGEVTELGPEVSGWKVGDRAMALLAGGGQAEKVAVPTGQLMQIPDGLGYEDAAALPEVALTSWTNLIAEGRLERGQSVLITAAASGVGTFAVQLARELGARVLVAGRDMLRLERLRELGAEACIPLDESLPAAVRAITDGPGVDLVIDLAGGAELSHRLKALRNRGRLVLVGLLAGAAAQIDLGDVLRRRLRLTGSVLRARSREEKARLVADFSAFAAERLVDGRLRPIIHQVIPLTRVAEAYALMERGGVFGKLVLSV